MKIKMISKEYKARMKGRWGVPSRISWGSLQIKKIPRKVSKGCFTRYFKIKAL
jgi:hypothetical protein